uniref:GATA-type domain-containing protein n=1 Tax=Oryza barthii TaxID=65489 RepID=A0A0D3HJ28_9ORYZ
MPKPTPSSSSFLDFTGGVDGDDDDPSCPFEGLCCPDDPLDQVLNFDSSDFGHWDHAAAPSSSATTTPSDSSLSSPPSLTSAFPRIARVFPSRTKPRRRCTLRRQHWSLICPLHLVPVAAAAAADDDDAAARGKSISELNASAAADAPSTNDRGGGSYHRRVVGRQRNRQVRKDRRCSHCGTSETPQWRMGPDGPGTLCNACGIRSKMDRLLPEYRPSTSPGFGSDGYSNRHSKVVKLREKKMRD